MRGTEEDKGWQDERGRNQGGMRRKGAVVNSGIYTPEFIPTRLEIPELVIEVACRWASLLALIKGQIYGYSIRG
jgi:hypothetical protein